MLESAEKDIKIIILHNFKKLSRDMEDAKANSKSNFKYLTTKPNTKSQF